MSDLMRVFDAVETSNMQPAAKAKVENWLARASGHISTKAREHLATESGSALVSAVRQYSVAMATGATLGVISAEGTHGLDIPVGNASVPVDGGVAVLGFFAKLILSALNHPLGEHVGCGVGEAGATSGGIMTFRKFDNFLRLKRSAISGDSNSGGKASTSEIEKIVAKL